MGGGHCLICYSLIPNSSTFNSGKNLQNCVSFCKLLLLPVEPFRDILSKSPTCPECTRGLQKGAQIIKRFEKLQKELNQLRTAFQNKLVKAHKLSFDLEDGHKERRSIIKELNLDVASSENDLIDIPAAQFNNQVDPGNDIDDQYDISQVEEDPMDYRAYEEEIEMDSKEIFSLPQPNLLQFPAKDLRLPPRVAQNDHEKPSTSSSKVKGIKRRMSPASRAEMYSSRSNRITLKVPLLQLDRLPLPRGQITFNLDDLLSLGLNPLQNTRRPPANLPESSFKLKFVCRLCCRFLPNHSLLSTHYNYFDHSSSVYRCCGEELSTIYAMQRHRVKFHPKRIGPPKPKFKVKNSIQCDKCDKCFSDRILLKTHVNRVHLNLKPFACTWPGCQKSFNEKRLLKEHMNLHQDNKPFLCEHCPKTFVSQRKLSGHRKQVHGTRIKGVFKCDSCPSTFPYEKALQGHIKRVHNHNHILCSICGFELKQQEYYRDHMEMHKLKGDKFRPRKRSCWKKESK